MSPGGAGQRYHCGLHVWWLADTIPAPHWHREEPGTVRWEAQARPLFLTQGSGVFFRVSWTLQGLLCEGILGKLSMKSLAVEARGFPRDVWMLVGAPRT